MKYKEKKNMIRQKEEIVLTVPSFINQLLLTMNSGMVLADAFKKIAARYGKLAASRQNYFTREVYRIYETSLNSGENVITLFYQFGRRSQVKELIRVSGIMMENMDKGNDLWDKLAEEGELLWQERKRLALEKMRVSESKMSFPLGLLLISLVLVIAGPALLQIR